MASDEAFAIEHEEGRAASTTVGIEGQRIALHVWPGGDDWLTADEAERLSAEIAKRVAILRSRV